MSVADKARCQDTPVEWKVAVDILLPGIGTRRASRRGGLTYAVYNIRLHDIQLAWSHETATHHRNSIFTFLYRRQLRERRLRERESTRRLARCSFTVFHVVKLFPSINVR